MGKLLVQFQPFFSHRSSTAHFQCMFSALIIMQLCGSCRNTRTERQMPAILNRQRSHSTSKSPEYKMEEEREGKKKKGYKSWHWFYPVSDTTLAVTITKMKGEEIITNSYLLMLLPSFSLSPAAPVLVALSLPAKSTRLSLPTFSPDVCRRNQRTAIIRSPLKSSHIVWHIFKQKSSFISWCRLATAWTTFCVDSLAQKTGG